MAGRVVQKIFRSVDLLKENPAIGRAGRVAGTRELVVAETPYIIPYRVRANAVEILRVFHAARSGRRSFEGRRVRRNAEAQRESKLQAQLKRDHARRAVTA